MICFDLAIDQIAQSGLSSLKVIYYSAQLFSIGAGYYNKTLDAIITYAPSALYQNNVGVTIAADHPGREVMRTNTPLVYSGRQVRGDILNSMIPIERNGEILGYIWANELTEDIRRQA
ncbi:sensory histidine kinase AtoS [Shigella dysenteriae]|nr:sensory histidine kinase AtoS [Shigella dysenteriae]